MTAWNPHAVRNPLADSGAFLGGRPKGLLHTTEGASYPGPQLYHGSQPHFTIDIPRRQLWQHVPINLAAMSLENRAGGVQTNRENVVQIECVGFTFRSPDGHFPRWEVRNWTDADIEFLAGLMRWVEHNAGVPRQAGVSFSHPVRMTGAAWEAYSGWCGHVHCPENSHVDGTGMPIAKLLHAGAGPLPPAPDTLHTTLRRGATGAAVHHLQVSLHTLGYKLATDGVFGPATYHAVLTFQRRHQLQPDGVVGRRTWVALHEAVKAHKP